MNDFSQTVKKDRNRHIARMILGAVLILLETALFYYIWIRFYNPLVRRPYFFKGNFFVAGVYMVVLMLFGMSIAWVWGFGFEPRNQWGRRVWSPWTAWGLMLLGAYLTFGR